MYTPTPLSDKQVPVKRLQLDRGSGRLQEAPKADAYIKGPIPIKWLDKAAKLPGKALNVALALWWLYGMAKRKPFKLTQQALDFMHVGRDAVGDGLTRLEQAGLIQVERKPGQRPAISIIR
jgi:hypothetical protein